MHASPVFHGEKPWIFARLFRPGAGVEVPPVKRSPAYEITMSWWNNLKLLKSEFSKQWQTYLYVHGIYIYTMYINDHVINVYIYIMYINVYIIYIYILCTYIIIYIICDILKCWENPGPSADESPCSCWNLNLCVFQFSNTPTHMDSIWETQWSRFSNMIKQDKPIWKTTLVMSTPN